MKEVTTFKEGELKVEFDGKNLRVYLNSYNDRSFSSLSEAVIALGSLLAMATKAVSVGKDRMIEESKDNEKPLDLSDIPF